MTCNPYVHIKKSIGKCLGCWQTAGSPWNWMEEKEGICWSLQNECRALPWRQVGVIKRYGRHAKRI